LKSRPPARAHSPVTIVDRSPCRLCVWIGVELCPRRTTVLPDLERLARTALNGDEDAWQELWQAVEPRLYAVLRRPQVLGKLSQSVDDCRNIIVEVMGRLRANDYARLGQFVLARERNPALPFMAWLIVVAKRVAIDYMRAHEFYIDRRHVDGASSPGRWREPEPLPSDSQAPGERPPITNRGTALELVAFAGSDLPAEQRSALEAWLQGSSFAEIAGSGDVKEAENRVRAALRRLRRRFRTEAP
jgi:DNA-directed RNA polymerase specialized sigma24 family protein